jgi:hypothetical protein
MASSQMPKLTKRQLEKLLSDWTIIAKSTFDCPVCDKYYETPFEWLNKKERKRFVDHLYNVHVHPKKKSYK